VFERFTEPARQVVVLAQDEARSLGHNYIGTEHILLGLLREADGLGARALQELDVGLEDVRSRVVELVGQGVEVASGQIPFTPRAKEVLELAFKESKRLVHPYIGTEHILLGLVRENDGVATQVLIAVGVDADTIRNAVEQGIANEPPSPTEPPWDSAPRGVPFVRVTESSNRARERLLGLWLKAHIALLAVAIVFGAGLLVGWLIWG
jgi:ATP-dependent Clp protease ATP-binding subunit ClpC